MLTVDVGDHCDGRRKFQKRSVTFVGFRHYIISLSENCVGADAFQLAADNHSRIQAAFSQHRSHDRRGGCFAVCPGYSHTVFQPHQLGQHLCTRNDGNGCLFGRPDFRIGRSDGRRYDHHIGTADMFIRMALVNNTPQGLQIFGDIGRLDIRS